MRTLALLALLSCATACGRRAAIYAGSDVSAAGSAAVPLDGRGPDAEPEPDTDTEPEPPPNLPTAGRAADGGSTPSIDASIARDAAAPEPDAASPATPDAEVPIEAGAPCAAGHVDCDGDASNGCEVDVQVDEQHCGACEKSCDALASGVTGAACIDGSCQLTCQFAPIAGDCDGDPNNGCETDLWHDPNNCSVCGKQCNRCIDGACR